MYLHQTHVITAGKPISQGGKVLILVHGRGATAGSILALSEHLNVADFSLLAPQATNNSWYPYSFMAPTEQNQPALDSAILQIDAVVKNLQTQEVESRDIYFLGFSQGACLVSEYAARHAQQFGGLIIFTGGLIGPQIDTSLYTGHFNGTPVLLTTGDPDSHVPVSQVNETADILTDMGAVITKKIFRNRPHTILPEEINLANNLFFKGK